MKYPFTKKDWDEMQVMRDDRHTVAEIARLYKVTPSYVRLHTLTPRITVGQMDKGKAQALRNAGWSVEQIADELRCTIEAVAENTCEAAVRTQKPLEWMIA